MHELTRAPKGLTRGSEPTYRLSGMTLKDAGITLAPGESYVIDNPAPTVYVESGRRLTDKEMAIVLQMQADHGGFSR